MTQMKKSKKYDYQVTQDTSGWKAEIIRKKTSREMVVSKSQTGFSSEVEAQEWGQKELKSFVQILTEQNKQRAKEQS